MFSSKASFRGGTHITAQKKLTSGLPIIEMEAPPYIYLPLSMHIGAPAKPIVAAGDNVKLGQLVAKASGFVSANIHASVSGKVERIERRYLPNGGITECLVIRNDGLDTFSDEIDSSGSLENLTAEKIRSLLQEKGIVGMGGAAFPTHVKYAPPKDGPGIDMVIINGIECEPFVTADHRVLLEKPKEVIRGLKYFLLASGAARGVIAIEDNKPDAISLLTELTENESNIEVVTCQEKYPQGSEKQLIYAVTGRIVPERALPASVGVIVDNVSTAVQTALAVETGLPCYERVLTVNGDAVARPGNYLVRIGSLYSDVVTLACGGTKAHVAKILCGGPMMGFAVSSLEYSVIKGTTGILLFSPDSGAAEYSPEQTCVRCGRCLEVCPMFLQPTVIAKAVKRKKWYDAVNADISACIECGCCSYSCPAHIPLVQYIRMGKQFIMTDGSGGFNPLYSG